MKTLWQISREYAGIAEAGGVKNVVCSLSEGFIRHGYDVTAFMPLYGCSSLSAVTNYRIIKNLETTLSVRSHIHDITFAEAYLNEVRLIFVISKIFLEKQNVYTYTRLEEKQNQEHKRGQGHFDAEEMNILFQKSILEYGKLTRTIPDILHCHDATTAMLPVMARELPEYTSVYADTHFVTTIHNAGPAYHHQFESLQQAVNFTGLSEEVLKKGLSGKVVEPYLIAGHYGELTTVSPWYADEILQPENDMTEGLSASFHDADMKITGITNGIDFHRYDPENVLVSCLPYAFSPERADFEGKMKLRNAFLRCFSQKVTEIKPETEEDAYIINKTALIEQFGNLDAGSIYFAYHGRIVHQKGITVLTGAIPKVLEKYPEARFIIIGQGAADCENALIETSEKNKGKIIYLRGYDRTITRLCIAAGDFLVLPSFFEPCGLEDFIGSIFGTIPVAHSTGGLQKIRNEQTGFLYDDNTVQNLADTLISLCRRFSENNSFFDEVRVKAALAVREEYNWNAVIEHCYKPFFESLIKR